MEKLLIAKSTVTYGGTITVPGTAEGAVTPDLLAPGALGLYGFHRGTDGLAKFALITNTAATSLGTPGAYKVNVDDYNGDEVQFYLGATGPRQASPMQLRGIKRLEAKSYVAPVKQVKSVLPPAVPTTPTRFDEYTLVAERVISKREDNNHSTYNVVGSYASITLLVDAFIAAINARPNKGFTASRTGSGNSSRIVLSADNEGEVLFVGVSDLLTGATIATDTEMVVGTGSYNWLHKKELNTRGEQGYFNQIDTRDKAIALLADPAGTYDVYIFEFCNVEVLKDETDDSFTNREELILAIPDGSPQGAVIEAIFTQFATDGKLGTTPVFSSAAATVGGTTTTGA